MNRLHQSINSATIFVCIIAMCIVASTVSAQIAPVSQQFRQVFGDAFGNGGDGTLQDIQSVEAPNFERFSEVLHTESQHPNFVSSVISWQDSIISPCALIAAGGFESTSITEPGSVFAYAQGMSQYDVTFTIQSETPMQLLGYVDVDPNLQVRVQLFKDNQAIMNDSFGDATIELDTSLVLEPGEYRLAFRALGVALTTPPGNQTLAAHYRLQLRACGPAEDLTGDGVVDVSDLFLLLAGWGDCAGDTVTDCLADINGSHTVDVTDLFALLSKWTG